MHIPILIFVGAGLGGVLRYFISIYGTRLLPIDFPLATMFINITGSIAMGVIAALFVMKPDMAGSQEWRLFLTTGLLGGYTTFSTFSLDAVYLWERGEPLAAFGYVAGSLVFGIAGLFAGLMLVRGLSG